LRTLQRGEYDGSTALVETVVSAGAPAATVTVELASGAKGSATLTFKEPRLTNVLEEARTQGLVDPISMASLTWRTTSTGRVVTMFDDAGRIATPHLLTNAPPVFHVDYVPVGRASDMSTAYTQLEKAGALPVVIQALQTSMPGLRDLRALRPHEKWIVHCFFDGRPPVPVFAAGDGLKRILAIAGTVAASRDVVLIEEPDSFCHPRYLRELARLLIGFVRDGKQIILTTHSLELLDALLECDERPETASEDWPTVHRLKLDQGVLSAVRFTREEALVGRHDLQADLRS
jgi:hypothetical protein